LERRDEEAIRNQRTRFTFAFFAVALGPLAVLLLAIQVTAFPEGGAVASGLITLELAIVAIALSIAFLQMGRSHDHWLRERLRAEILRREIFLLGARVGPYLGATDAATDAIVDERLLAIDNDVKDPVDLLPLGDADEPWRDALENAHEKGDSGDVPDFPASLNSYLEDRVAGQRSWFVKKNDQHGRRARLFEHGAKLVLTLALIVAGVHLGLLLAQEKGHKTGAVHVAVIIVAIVLPPLGAAFVGLQSISGSHRLSRSYVFHAQALERLERHLRRLKNQVRDAKMPMDRLQFEFKRFVLETEQLLSDELRLFWFIMHPEAPRPS
jgi:hypothetical protein